VDEPGSLLVVFRSAPTSRRAGPRPRRAGGWRGCCSRCPLDRAGRAAPAARGRAWRHRCGRAASRGGEPRPRPVRPRGSRPSSRGRGPATGGLARPRGGRRRARADGQGCHPHRARRGGGAAGRPSASPRGRPPVAGGAAALRRWSPPGWPRSAASRVVGRGVPWLRARTGRLSSCVRRDALPGPLTDGGGGPSPRHRRTVARGSFPVAPITAVAAAAADPPLTTPPGGRRPPRACPPGHRTRQSRVRAPSATPTASAGPGGSRVHVLDVSMVCGRFLTAPPRRRSRCPSAAVRRCAAISTASGAPTTGPPRGRHRRTVSAQAMTPRRGWAVVPDTVGPAHLPWRRMGLALHSSGSGVRSAPPLRGGGRARRSGGRGARHDLRQGDPPVGDRPQGAPCHAGSGIGKRVNPPQGSTSGSHREVARQVGR
jgi:hypothetical protein